MMNIKETDYQKYLFNRFLNEDKEDKEDVKEAPSEKSGEEKTKEVKDPKGKIISGLEGMKPGAVMQAIAKSLGTSSPKFLGSHIINILVNAAKNGKVKFDALKRGS